MDIELTKEQIKILKDLAKTNRGITQDDVKNHFQAYKGLQKIGFIDYPILDDPKPRMTKIVKPMGPMTIPIAGITSTQNNVPTIETTTVDENPFKVMLATNKITAAGRAWLEAHKAKKVKWSIEFIIPTLISIGALVVSIIALVTK